MYVGVEEHSACFWLVAEGNEAWSEITQRVTSETTYMNDLEPDDIPLNFFMYLWQTGEVWEVGKRKKRIRERETDD